MNKKNGFAWPNGKRIAIVVDIMMETWTEGTPPPYTVQTTSLRPGTVNRSGVAWGQYGGKVGVWRLLNVVNQAKVPATFGVNARCAELYPAAIAEIVKSGHDLAGHGYLQDQTLAYMTAAEEKATIRRSLDILERVSGKRPEGWISSVLAFTEHTAGYLAEEGLLWQGDALDIDMPCLTRTPSGNVVQIPCSDFSDNRALRASPLIYFEAYKETFDYLYQREAPSFLNLLVHCHFGGRPTMAAMFDKVLKYFAQFPEVWFARNIEVARWMLDQGIDEVSYAQRFFGA